MSQVQTLAGLHVPFLFLKAVHKRRVFVPTFTKQNGTVVQGHYADVNVSDDHDDEKVLSGRGSHSQKQAHAKLSQHDWFNALPTDHRVNLLLHHATKIQTKASNAAAVSGWRVAALAGRSPTPGQWRAFHTMPQERRDALLAEVARDGRPTAHLNDPGSGIVSPATASAAPAAAPAPAPVAAPAPAHPVSRPAQTLGAIGLSDSSVDVGGKRVLADSNGVARVFFHGGPTRLDGAGLNDATFFAVNRADAADYARQHDAGTVHEAHLAISKPASGADVVAAARAVGVNFENVEGMDPEAPEANAWSLITPGHSNDAPRVLAKLKEWGFDGAAFSNDFTASGDRHIKSIVPFSASQIVSVPVAAPAAAPAPARRVVGAARVPAAVRQAEAIDPSKVGAWLSAPRLASGQIAPGTDTTFLDHAREPARRKFFRWHTAEKNTQDAALKDRFRSAAIASLYGIPDEALTVKGEFKPLSDLPAGVSVVTDPAAIKRAAIAHLSGGAAAPAPAAASTGGVWDNLEEGATKVEDGVSYVLRGGRWHRASEDAPAIASTPTVVPSASPADRAGAATAMSAVPRPHFPLTSDSNAGCVRRVGQLRALADAGDIDAITNFATSRTRANYARVADYRDALLAAAQNLTPAAAVAAVQSPPPAAPQLTGANMQNTALLAAQRKINMLADAARAADPVAAIQAINTSRGNRYLDAADNYKRALLAHFGADVNGTPVPGVTAEGVAPPARVVAAAPAATPAATPALAADAPLTFSDRRYRRGGMTGWQFETRLGGWGSVQDASMRARLNRGEDPVEGGGTRAEVTARARNAATPVPDTQNPALAANPLGLSEAELGFVPRPNVPLTVATNRPPVAFPDPRMEEINRRYLAQSTTLQSRARQYQEGTWVPDTPQARAARAAAEAEEQRRQQEAIRAAAAAVEARMGSIEALFRPRAVVGANVQSFSMSGSEADCMAFLGVPKAVAENLFKTMVADYGNNVKFSVSASVRGGAAEVRYNGDDGTTITRQFSKNNGSLTVYHAYFQAGSTGEGSGRHLFRNSMGVYKALGVTEVGVTANIDVGGYAWARFGYLPRNWSDIKGTLKARLERMQRGDYSFGTNRGGSRRAAPMSDEHYRMVKGLLDNSTPETMWAIADMKIGERSVGKELLLGTNWSGVMRLGHKPTMIRFAKYVNPDRSA